MTVKGRVVVVGAGMGGLAASIALAGRGLRVTTLDAADGPGGKMREVRRAGVPSMRARLSSRCPGCSSRSSRTRERAIWRRTLNQPCDWPAMPGEMAAP